MIDQLLSGPQECINRCKSLRNHQGVAPNQATVDTRSGRYCFCRFHASGVNGRSDKKTCRINRSNIGMIYLRSCISFDYFLKPTFDLGVIEHSESYRFQFQRKWELFLMEYLGQCRV